MDSIAFNLRRTDSSLLLDCRKSVPLGVAAPVFFIHKGHDLGRIHIAAAFAVDVLDLFQGPFLRLAYIQVIIVGDGIAFVLFPAAADFCFEGRQLADFTGDTEVFALVDQVTPVFILGGARGGDGIEYLKPNAIGRTLEMSLAIGDIHFRCGFADLTDFAFLLERGGGLHAADGKMGAVIVVDGMPFQAVLAILERHVAAYVALFRKEVRRL